VSGHAIDAISGECGVSGQLGINALRASETAVSLAPIDRVRMVDGPFCESADVVRLPSMIWAPPLYLVACRYVDFGRTSSAVCCHA